MRTIREAAPPTAVRRHAQLRHEALTRQILGTFFEVYNELGGGFLESVYKEAMSLALTQRGISFEREAPLSVSFRGVVVGSFRADLLVGNKVLVEFKALAALDRSHTAQVLNYLRATELEVALLLNFGPKPLFKRLAFDNSRKCLRLP
jgi:GxxExxY protein